MGVFRFRPRDPQDAAPVPHVAALDVGSHKIACLIARAEPGAEIEILGAAVTPSDGVRGGVVVDVEAAEAAIRTCVEEAERAAGAPISSVTLGFGGGRPHSLHASAGVGLEIEREIGERDLRRGLDAALRRIDAPGRVILHALPSAWSVDDDPGVRDPRGMFGARLAVDLHVITAAAGAARTMAACVEKAGVRLRRFVSAPYAAALSTLIDDEVDLGAAVVDIGAGVTSIAVFFDGALQHVDAVPVGGRHVTQDLARGLSMTVADAERLKREVGTARLTATEDCGAAPYAALGSSQADRRAPHALIGAVVRARMEEIFELVDQRLVAAGLEAAAGSRLVLTGGGARLDGVDALAERVSNKRVRIAAPRRLAGLADAVAGPECAVAAGLVRHRLTGPREAVLGPPRLTPARPMRAPAQTRGGWSRAASWLRDRM